MVKRKPSFFSSGNKDEFFGSSQERCEEPKRIICQCSRRARGMEKNMGKTKIKILEGFLYLDCFKNAFDF